MGFLTDIVIFFAVVKDEIIKPSSYKYMCHPCVCVCLIVEMEKQN